MAQKKYDLEKVRQCYDRARQRAQAERYTLERDWFRNVLYFCMAYGTRIPLLNGNTVEIQDLVAMGPTWLYGFDCDSLSVVPTLMEKCWQTGEKECVRVELDNGNSFTCTADHRILTWFGYEEAGKLLPGMPLVPYRNKFYRSTSEGGYSQVFQPYDAEWEQTHRMVAREIYGRLPNGVIVHHQNENKLDNRPENLVPMKRGEHSAMTLGKHKHKIVEAVREWKRRPENRKAQAERASKQWLDNYDTMLAANKAFRAKPEYLENLRKKTAEFWSDPEKRAKRIDQMKQYWQQKRDKVNCRVVSVVYDGIKPVYDMSVPATENFALEAGVFAHNCGIQWIIYSAQTRKWKPRKVAKWVPRPVTNKFAAIANTIMQTLSSKEPDTRARPGSDSPEDVAAANVADRNFDVLLKEMDSEQARGTAAAWLTLTGSAMLHVCYDKDQRHGTTFVQHLQCADCQKTFAPDLAGPPVPVSPMSTGMSGMATDMAAQPPGMAGGPMPMPVGSEPVLPPEPTMSEASCPQCHSPNITEAPEDVGEKVATGKLKLEVFSPFETFIDLESRPGEEQEILVRRRYPLDVIRERYGKPDLESDNNSNVGGAIGLNLLRAIAYAAGNAMYGTGIASGRNVGDDQSITVDMLWKRPNADFPNGLVAIYANERLLNDGKGTDEDCSDGIPYKDRNDTPIWPWHLVKFDEVPGRCFGKTPMDDVAGKQEQRNKLESLIQLIITRMASPQWLVAKGLGVTEFTGEPGQVIEGNWAMDPRLRPERVSGENVPTSVIAWLEKIDKDMEELAGTFEVLRGSAPAGVTAGTALRLLLERANTRFTPVLKRFENAWEKVCKDALVIFQQYGTQERINKIQGPGNTWEIERFSKADLNGSVDVVVEAGSSIPKSTVGEQALLQDLVTMQIINPMEPDTQYKILEKFGSTGLLGAVDLNIRYAQRENWKFINEQTPPVINPVLDVHPVHITVHKQYALTSDFEVLDEQQRNIMLAHILEHQMAMMPPPMPVGPPGVGSSPNGSAEKGGPPNGSPGEPPTPPGMPGVPPPQGAQNEGEPPLFPGA